MWLVVLLMLLVFLLAVFRNPANALATTLMLFAFEQFAQVHVSIFRDQTAVMNVIFALFVGIALTLRMRRGEQVASNISHGTLLLVAMYIAHPVSALWSPDPAMTLSTFIKAAPYIVVLTFMVSVTVRSVDDLQTALNSLWLLGSILLVLIMASVDFANRGLLLERLGRAKYSEANPLALSGVAGEVAIIAVVLQPWRSRIGRLLCGASAILALYVCVRTGSRGQLVGAVVVLAGAVVMQAWIGTISTWRVALFAVLGGATLVWLSGVATEQFGSRFSLEQMRSVYEGGRMGPSEEMLKVWAKAGPWAWVWGLGGSSSYHYIGFYPHVVPVEVLTELGMVGIAMYGAFAVLATHRARWLLGVVTHDRKDIIVCACALFAYEWTLALKQGAMLAADYMMCHGLVIAGIAQVWKLRSEADSSNREHPIGRRRVLARVDPTAG
jgi:hypothetical protein